MNAKEKAEELVRKYYTFGINKEGQTLSWLEAKQCALICVDQLMNQFIEIHNNFKGANLIKGDVKDSANYIYWNEVKKQIEKL